MAVIDLTLPVNRHMQGIPNLREYGENPTRCVVLSCMGEVQKAYLESRDIELDENLEFTPHMLSRLEILTHIGTHIDAPCHFLESGGWTVEQIPLEHTIGKGVVVPLTHLQGRERITADEIIRTGVELDNSVIPVLHTGWTERAWGTDEFWGESIFLDTTAAEYIVEKGCKAVALDCFPEAPFWLGIEADEPPGRNHKTLLGNKTIIIQLLTNIGKLNGREFTLYGIPLPLDGMDGSPARVFAITE